MTENRPSVLKPDQDTRDIDAARALYAALRTMHEYAMRYDEDYPGSAHATRTLEAFARYEEVARAV